jgi:hypothetical protein
LVPQSLVSCDFEIPIASLPGAVKVVLYDGHQGDLSEGVADVVVRRYGHVSCVVYYFRGKCEVEVVIYGEVEEVVGGRTDLLLVLSQSNLGILEETDHSETVVAAAVDAADMGAYVARRNCMAVGVGDHEGDQVASVDSETRYDAAEDSLEEGGRVCSQEEVVHMNGSQAGLPKAGVILDEHTGLRNDKSDQKGDTHSSAVEGAGNAVSAEAARQEEDRILL